MTEDAEATAAERADLVRRLDGVLLRAVERGRELAERLLESAAEPAAAEHRLAVLETLCRLPAEDLETVDRLCTALLDPGAGRGREAAVEVVDRLFRDVPTDAQEPNDQGGLP